MFNVIRIYPAPNCSDYRSKEVMNTLRGMFYGKCYLRENDIFNPVVEHFKAHKGDKKLMHDWDNLYYACDRCNSIKETEVDNKNLEIIDCCDSAIDVFQSIKCLCASVPDGVFFIEAQNDDVKTKNTAKLLDQCYNSDNTGNRGITRDLLHEQIFEKYIDFINYRRIIKSKDSLQSAKDNAKEHLKNMTDVSYPFSIFWKWHIKSDIFLSTYLA